MLSVPLTHSPDSKDDRRSITTWVAPFRLILLLFALSCGPLRVCAQEHWARFDDGVRWPGELQGATAEQLTFTSRGKTIPRDFIQRISFRSRSSVRNPATPARVFHLKGGGMVTGELVELTPKTVAFQTRGKQVTLPRRAVLAIDQRRGERQRLYEDFHENSQSSQWESRGPVKRAKLKTRTVLQMSPGSQSELRFPAPLKAGRISTVFLMSPTNDVLSSGLELQFGDETTGHSLTIALDPRQKSYTVNHSANARLTVLKVRYRRDWETETVIWDQNRLRVLIGSHVLALGRAPDAALRSVRLFSESKEAKAAYDAPPVFWCDDFYITESIATPELPKSIVLDRQSQIVLENGDVVFGKLVAVDSQRVQLKGTFGMVTLPWQNVRRIVFGETDFPNHPTTKDKPSLGWQGTLQFSSFADCPGHWGDRLPVTVTAVQEGQITMEHSVLGQLQVPAEQVDWFEPAFFGTRLVLAAETAHLGNQIRPKFRHKEPLGSSWHGEFQLEQPPKGEAFLRVQISELEPAGKNTPPASRYLSELRNGFLGTAVILNGTSLGRLNDRISQREALKGNQTVRLPIPGKLLRKGKNTWRIKQTPRRNNPQEFDDCEIGPLWLEIETE